MWGRSQCYEGLRHLGRAALRSHRWGRVIGIGEAFAGPAPLAGTPPSASRFAPMLSGGTPTIGAAKEMDALQRQAHQHLTETDTSGCAGRRRWSAATGGGTHTPRWRFQKGSSIKPSKTRITPNSPPAPPASPRQAAAPHQRRCRHLGAAHRWLGGLENQTATHRANARARCAARR